MDNSVLPCKTDCKWCYTFLEKKRFFNFREVFIVLRTIQEKCFPSNHLNYFRDYVFRNQVFCFCFDFYCKVNTEHKVAVRQTMDKFWTIIGQPILRETVIYFVKILSTL